MSLCSVRWVSRSTVRNTIDIVAASPQFVVVNKPSGVRCFGNHDSNCLLPQLTSYFKRQAPDQPLDPHSFKIMQRLDRFVTGGMVVGRDKRFSHQFSQALQNKGNLAVHRYYVGLITIPDTFDSVQHYVRSEVPYLVGDGQKGLVFEDSRLVQGQINYHITSFVKDYRQKNQQLVTQTAVTRFRLLEGFKREEKEYLGLFKGRLLVPLVMRLETGRKNQIRDHIHQAFGTTLLNDDNFVAFKNNSRKESKNLGSFQSVNSELYHNNQIALHSVKIEMGPEEWVVPVGHKSDRWLWGNMVDRKGEFRLEVVDQLLYL